MSQEPYNTTPLWVYLELQGQYSVPFLSIGELGDPQGTTSWRGANERTYWQYILAGLW